MTDVMECKCVLNECTENALTLSACQFAQEYNGKLREHTHQHLANETLNSKYTIQKNDDENVLSMEWI